MHFTETYARTITYIYIYAYSCGLLFFLYVSRISVAHGAPQGRRVSPIENRCFNAVVPNPWDADRHRSVGQLVPDRTERMHILHYFHFIYYLILNNVLF